MKGCFRWPDQTDGRWMQARLRFRPERWQGCGADAPKEQKRAHDRRPGQNPRDRLISATEEGSDTNEPGNLDKRTLVRFSKPDKLNAADATYTSYGVGIFRRASAAAR